ncbi:MAG: hypothetical protein J6T53_01310, partial [Bacteroidales bacterium]|nr:hypothetical protein [Bacteroidales bacterium]
MSQDNQNTDLSFLEKKDANALSLKDVVVTILRNIHWFILCAAIGANVAWYISDKADRIYESHAKIKIYETQQSTVMSQLDQIASFRSRAVSNSMNDEIIIIKSETSMLEVVKHLNLSTYYEYETKLIKRKKDLYKDSPIEAFFLDMNERESVTFNVLLQNDSLISLKFADGSENQGRFGDT